MEIYSLRSLFELGPPPAPAPGSGGGGGGGGGGVEVFVRWKVGGTQV